MPVRWYHCLLVDVTLPGGRIAPMPRTMIYAPPPDARHSSFRTNRARARVIVRVDCTDAQHADIQADPQITLLPFVDAGGNYLSLDAPVSQITAANRTALAAMLEAVRVPTEWITGSTTIREVLRFALIVFRISQKWQDDFPDISLNTTLGELSAAARNRVSTWMDNHDIDRSDFTLSTTVRQVLRRIARDFPKAVCAWELGTIPLLTLDSIFDNLVSDERQLIRDWLISRGVGAGWITAGMTIRDIVREVLARNWREAMRVGPETL